MRTGEGYLILMLKGLAAAVWRVGGSAVARLSAAGADAVAVIEDGYVQAALEVRGARCHHFDETSTSWGRRGDHRGDPSRHRHTPPRHTSVNSQLENLTNEYSPIFPLCSG
jgi:hypothetical protein